MFSNLDLLFPTFNRNFHAYAHVFNAFFKFKIYTFLIFFMMITKPQLSTSTTELYNLLKTIFTNVYWNLVERIDIHSTTIHSFKLSRDEFWFRRQCKRFSRSTHSLSTLYVRLYILLLSSCHSPCQERLSFVPECKNTDRDSSVLLICNKLIWNPTIQLSGETKHFQLSFDCRPMHVEGFG